MTSDLCPAFEPLVLLRLHSANPTTCLEAHLNVFEISDMLSCGRCSLKESLGVALVVRLGGIERRLCGIGWRRAAHGAMAPGGMVLGLPFEAACGREEQKWIPGGPSQFDQAAPRGARRNSVTGVECRGAAR